MNPDLPKISVALLAFMDEDGRIMLNRRADADSEAWEMIGGGIEGDESPDEAIRREIKEETGYTLKDTADQLKLVKVFSYKGQQFIAKIYGFTAIYPGKDKFVDSRETYTDDLEMFTIEEARKLPLLPMTKLFLGDE